MRKVNVVGLDQIYLELKNISDSLRVTGYEASFEGVSYNQSDSLLGWFIKFIPALKVGIESLLVASAFGSSKGYSLYEDSVFMSTQQTNFGLLVELNIHRYYDECYEEEKTLFLLEYKRNSQFL